MLLNNLQIFGLSLLLVSTIGASRPFDNTSQNAIPENCFNAVDDDNDGLIDLNDPDCFCELIEPVSLIPNPSFEDMNCCPFERSQLDCADVWIQASEPTTDYIHTCNWLGWPGFPPPMPFPDGEGILGFRDGRAQGEMGVALPNWKEYAGACLLSPLQADTAYRFEFDVGFVDEVKSPPIFVTFFGTSDCANLPFGVGEVDLGCPTNGPNWVRLGAVRVSGGRGDTWVTASIDVVPSIDIAAIAIGPACARAVEDVSLYYFFDNLLLADLESFQLGIEEVNHPCAEDFSLSIRQFPEYTYQWYKEGIALVGETEAALSQHYGEGNYQVLVDDGESCRISMNYEYRIPIFESPLRQVICAGDSYPFGDRVLNQSGQYLDTFLTADNCQNIVPLELIVLGELVDTFSGQIFEGEAFSRDGFSFSREGEHPYTIPSSIGCDSLVLLELSYFHLFFPTAFSPNLDGVNDLFEVYGQRGLIEDVSLTIYDRWGAEVHTGSNWDGRHQDGFVSPGVYVYMAQVRMNDGLTRQFSGSVNVIR